MNLEQARFNMVEQQIRPWLVLGEDVRELLFHVRREDFVPAAYRFLAFAETEIPLGLGAAMLTPMIEAQALQALRVGAGDTVLEVGTGSGHMAALLAARAEQVWTVEIEPELAATARATLERLGSRNVGVETGDGLAGLPQRGPYDAIMVSGGLPVLPQALLDQLKVGGRLFAIVGEAPVMTARLVTRVGANDFHAADLFETRVAPLANAPAPARFAF